MNFDQVPFDLAQGVTRWLIVCGLATAVALFVGFFGALLILGVRGPVLMMDILRRAVGDLLGLSPRRIGALASLTVKEAVRKKTLYVFLVFVVLFMFAGWFLRASDPNNPLQQDVPAKPFVVFVLTAMSWICVILAALLACWGLPADIKERSLHTVVTKPVRRSEIVIGRMLGYGVVVTGVLALTALVGYVWVLRTVPERARAQLIARVPIYGSLLTLGRDGQKAIDEKTGENKGLNVGDIWTYRGYCEGNTKSAFIWTFTDLDVNALRQLGELRLENRFEAFRTFKGVIDQEIRYRITLVNNANNLRVTNSDLVRSVAEFADETQRSVRKIVDPNDEEGVSFREPQTAVVTIPRQLSYVDVAEDSTAPGKAKTVDLFDDLIDDGSLTVEVICLDANQYLGAAQSDLFIRMPDRSFASTYFKSVSTTWMMLMLVCMIGAAASCFLKGPVATLGTAALVLIGGQMRLLMGDLLNQRAKEGQVLGGGMLESFWRMVMQMNQQEPLPPGPASRIVKGVDEGVFRLLDLVQKSTPDFNVFNTAPYTANGFDVSWSTAFLPALATLAAFILPCVLVGYFGLQLRELESK